MRRLLAASLRSKMSQSASPEQMSPGGGNTTYRPELLYEYVVDGVTYHNGLKGSHGNGPAQ
jgi:hypothetical protein